MHVLWMSTGCTGSGWSTMGWMKPAVTGGRYVPSRVLITTRVCARYGHVVRMMSSALWPRRSAGSTMLFW